MMPKTRVEAFTDAVIAIILTLLILELKIPEKADWFCSDPIWTQNHYLFN